MPTRVESAKNQMFLKPIPGLTQFSPPPESLSILKSQTVDTVDIGEDHVYTVLITNIGTISADGSIVTDTFPPNFTFASCTIAYAGGATGPASATEAQLVAGVTITTLPRDATVTLTITGSFIQAGTYDNTAQVGDYTSTVTTTVPEPGDECWDEVILLVQRGVMVDTSPYAHSMTDLGGVTVGVANAGFPSGTGVRINAVHNGGGIQMSTGAEWTQGNGPRTYEVFVKVATGGLAIGGQIFFNDNFAFNGNVFYIAFSTGRPTVRYDGATTIAGGPIAIVENETWYVCIQTIGDDIYAWAGEVSTGVATGGLIAGIPVSRPVIAPSNGPYIGYVGGSGGTNDFVFDQLRITACERNAAVNSIPIPTTLFPESG